MVLVEELDNLNYTDKAQQNAQIDSYGNSFLSHDKSYQLYNLYSDKKVATTEEITRFHAYKVDCFSENPDDDFTYQYKFFRPLKDCEFEEICNLRHELNAKKSANELNEHGQKLLSLTNHVTVPLAYIYQKNEIGLVNNDEGISFPGLQTYVVSLERTPDRYESVHQKLDKLGFEDKKFSAIDGYNITLTFKGKKMSGYEFKENGFSTQKFVGYNIDCLPGQQLETTAKKFTHLRTFWENPMTMGELGIYCSSRILWDSIKGVEGVTLVLEDDVIPTLDLKHSLKTVLTNLPQDWDIVYLGLHPEFYRYYSINEMYNDVLEKISPYSVLWGIFAYLINNKSAEKLISLTSISDRPIDNMLLKSVNFESIIAYKSILPMFKVKFGNSEIQRMGRKVDVLQ